MAATFNTPPGWPTPPDGWTPPPGWEPDPSWPAPPPGWQFWSDGGVGPASGGPGASEAPTQSFDAAPTQVSPMGQPGQSGPDLYRYAPTTGLEQPGPSPYGTPDSAGAAPYVPAGYSPTGQGPGGYPPAGYSPGSSPPQRNRGAIVAIAVVAVLVLGAIVWGAASLFSGGGDEEATGDPTTAQPTTDEPTDPATTDEPTDPATTDEPTDAQTAGPMTDLGPGEPALASSGGTPIAEVRLLGTTPGWEPDSTMFCSEAENGQYLAIDLEFTTLPALAEQDPPTYSFIGLEMGALAGDTVIETSAVIGLFCLDTAEQPPSEMEPEQTYTGTVLLDVPEDVTAVTFTNLFDFTGDNGPYRWVLADQ